MHTYDVKGYKSAMFGSATGFVDLCCQCGSCIVCVSAVPEGGTSTDTRSLYTLVLNGMLTACTKNL